MKKSKLFMLAALSAVSLGAVTSMYADTLTFKIPLMAPLTLQADWIDSSGEDFGTMKLYQQSDGTVACVSFAGVECFAFEVYALAYGDWNTVYNETASWQMYSIVMNNGWIKAYTLSDGDSSKQMQNEKKALLSNKVGADKTIILK